MESQPEIPISNIVNNELSSKILQLFNSPSMNRNSPRKNKKFIKYKRKQSNSHLESSYTSSTDSTSSTHSLLSSLSIPLDLYTQSQNLTETNPSNFLIYATNIFSQNINEQYPALVGIRKCITLNLYINEMKLKGIINKLPELLESKHPEIQNETLWCLINLTSDSNIIESKVLIANGILNKILTLINKTDIEEIICNALWLIGNISDCEETRKELIRAECFHKIVDILSKSTNLEIIKQCFESMFNFWTFEPLIPFSLLIICFEALIKWFNIIRENSQNQEVDNFEMNAVWFLYYLTKYYKQSFNYVIESDIIKELIIIYIQKQNPDFQWMCFRLFVNITSGNDLYVDYLISVGIIQIIQNALNFKSTDKKIINECVKVLYNLTKGKKEQLILLIIGGVFNDLKRLLDEKKLQLSWISKKYIYLTFCNFTKLQDIEVITNFNFISIIEIMLRKHNVELLIAGLRALSNLLLLEQLKACLLFNGGIKFPLLNKINTGILKKRIMKLQKHKSVLVSKKANELFNNFLSKNRLVI